MTTTRTDTRETDINWSARYRVVDSRRTRSVYYAADSREALAAWLDAHGEWACTSSSEHQSRVRRGAMGTTYEVVESYPSVTTEGTPVTGWRRSPQMAGLIGRMTPGHEHSAFLD